MFNPPQPMMMSQQGPRPYQPYGGPSAMPPAPAMNPMGPPQQGEQSNPMMQMMQMKGMDKLMGMARGDNPMGGGMPIYELPHGVRPMGGAEISPLLTNQAAPMQGFKPAMAGMQVPGQGGQGFWPSWLTGMFR